MDQLLRPGMRLMRRLRVGGKFVSLAVLLMIPLTVMAAGSVASDTRQIAVVRDEQDGLRLVHPLLMLVDDLCLLRISEAAGASSGSSTGSAAATPSTTSATATGDLGTDISQVDAADRETGERLGLRADWARLRPLLTTLAAEQAAARRSTLPGPDAEATREATQESIDLIRRAADASQLILDPELDSYYSMIVLVDRLPSIMDAAANATEQAKQAGSAREIKASTHVLSDLGGRLSTDLGTAITVTRWSAFEDRVRSPGASVQSGIARFGVDLGRGADLSPNSNSGPGTGNRLAASVARLADTLASALDVLLERRGQALEFDRVRPLLLALTALAAVSYLFGALYRATSADVRRVLGDVSVVTDADARLDAPLTGPDEFAQMSRAVVFARDRLTTLLGTLRHQATHDELTGLPNRTLFIEQLAEALGEPGHRVGVLVIDLDGFKDVNDSFGHGIGDRMLRTLGARFQQAVQAPDLVARIGPDQFGVLLLDAGPDGARSAAVVEAVQIALHQPVDVDGRRLRVQASIGSALSGRGGGSATEMMRNADVAVHVAKSTGKGRVAVFEPAMHEATRERTELSFELVHAIEQDRLSLLYQPIIDIDTRSVHGVEALLRWNHPTRGMISPTEFVPLAEATGLIVPIGRWVMEQAVRQLATWRQERPDLPPLAMDINLSADQLADPTLVGDVLTLISETGVDPTSIVLEITESAVVRDLDSALKTLNQLSAVGVRLALDDFGTGYSSLSHLRRLPVSTLKIDKSFVTGETTHGDQRTAADVMLRGIVALGTGLGMEVVAEGIETEMQADRVRTAGCHLGQGFLWSEPVPADRISTLLLAGRPLDHLPQQRTR
jgi:diguanylate cyclase (GGDEF)-like protein